MPCTGYNVLDGIELLCQQLIPSLMKQLGFTKAMGAGQIQSDVLALLRKYLPQSYRGNMKVVARGFKAETLS